MEQLLDRLTQAAPDGIDVDGLVRTAGETVPPLWPLDSAIAVNPLAGFEHQEFAEALRDGARLFDARPTLATALWEEVMKRGDIDSGALRQVAVARLGGLDTAFETISGDRSRFDLLLARLNPNHDRLPSQALVAAARLAAPAEDATTRRQSPSPCERAGEEMLGYGRAIVAKWCGAFFDRSIACAGMPYRELGLYRSVLKLAAYDPDFWRFGGQDAPALVASASTDPRTAIEQSLIALGLEGSRRLDLLRVLVARLPGWAGHIRWREAHGDVEILARHPATMADYLALWLLVERACALRTIEMLAPRKADALAEKAAALAAQVGLDASDFATLPPEGRRELYRIAGLSHADLGMIWMEAAELTYRDRLIPQLERACNKLTDRRSRPAAQIVMCIDVRSEPFRRALEARGPYETFGYAGFFGLPIATNAPCGDRRARLPVLLSPAHDLALVPANGPGRESLDGSHRASTIGSALAELKSGAATSFSTAEALGPFAAIASVVKTMFPRLARRMAARDRNALAPVIDHHGCASGLPLQARIDAARALFAATGMARRTARLVLLAGHGGEATNNPYASALDCGACGGHAGGVNARAMAAVLNDAEVRAMLAQDGEALPVDTVFIAGEHNTTTDTVTIFDAESVPVSHRNELELLKADLASASDENRRWRALDLGWTGKGAFDAAAHWGEVRPEWGLARNAAFIVGPRSLTRDIDLEGRAFLHSYDWRTDADSSALTLILTAPMVVAQWINCQYLFSTLDNERWGAGDKTTHNVMGGIGVVQGNGGDLRVGLPRQSLFRDDGSPHHVPQRLLTVVYAPLSKVEAVIAAQPILQRLFGKSWVHLVVIDPASGRAKRWRPDSEETSPIRA
jgi:uncharacterized protein